MQSAATTVAEYLKSLPADRRDALECIRDTIKKNIDPVFQEGMQYGGIGYYVPHAVFPAGYHCDPKQPLPFAGLASQKHFMAIYSMGIYNDPKLFAWFQEAWAKSSKKKLDMGKCCIRFKHLDDVPLDVVAQLFRSMPAKKYIAEYEANLAAMRKTPKSKPAKKPAPPKKKPKVVAKKKR
jgi:hypothetical protein